MDEAHPFIAAHAATLNPARARLAAGADSVVKAPPQLNPTHDCAALLAE